jgi:hypothetical protein
VVAFSDELERWLSRTSPDTRDECVASNDNQESHETLSQPRGNMSALARQNCELICRMQVLQEQLRRSRRFRHHRMASRMHVRPAPARGASSAPTPTPTRRKRSLGTVDHTGWLPGIQNTSADEAGADFRDRTLFKKTRYQR